MLYFKNVELAKIYAVSEGTVRRWITATRAGKLDLQLYEHDGMAHIANTTKNKKLVEELVAKGKKHTNSRWHKVVSPTPEFYKMYDKRQIVDIITNIDIQREIPKQYDYFGAGADWWDTYAKRIWSENHKENSLTATVDLLQSNLENLDRLFEGYERVNVIDIGVGNALPVKELLAHLLYDTELLGRYIGLDVSHKMLEIAQANIKNWFKDRVNFEGHVRDIAYERFDDLLIDDDPNHTLNLVLLLGGTLNNFRAPDEVLKVIYHSMARNSLFITSRKLDSGTTRRYFDFSPDPSVPTLPIYHQMMLKRLNIDETLFEAKQEYNTDLHARYIGIELKVDLTINFNIEGKERSVTVNRGETILLWRAWHQSTIDVIHQLDRNGFILNEASLTSDQNFLLTISRIGSDMQRLS